MMNIERTFGIFAMDPSLGTLTVWSLTSVVLACLVCILLPLLRTKRLTLPAFAIGPALGSLGALWALASVDVHPADAKLCFVPLTFIVLLTHLRLVLLAAGVGLVIGLFGAHGRRPLAWGAVLCAGLALCVTGVRGMLVTKSIGWASVAALPAGTSIASQLVGVCLVGTAAVLLAFVCGTLTLLREPRREALLLVGIVALLAATALGVGMSSASVVAADAMAHGR